MKNLISIQSFTSSNNLKDDKNTDLPNPNNFLIKTHDVTFRINRKNQIFYIFTVQDHFPTLQEVFLRKTSEKKDFSALEVEAFLSQAVQMLIWLNSQDFFLNEVLFENIYYSLTKPSGSNPFFFKFDLTPRFDRLLAERLDPTIDIASVSKRNLVAFSSIAISLITMIEVVELKKIKSSKLLLSFLKNSGNCEAHAGVAFFLKTFFADGLLGYNLEQSYSLYTESIKSREQEIGNKLKVLSGNEKLFKKKMTEPGFLYCFRGNLLYFYHEEESKARAFRLLAEDSLNKGKILVNSHYMDERNILHFLYSTEKNPSLCSYSRIDLEKAALNQDDVTIIRDMFRILFIENKNKGSLERLFSGTPSFSFPHLLSLLHLDPSDPKSNTFSSDLQSTLSKILASPEKYTLDLEILYSLYDFSNNSTDIMPIIIRPIYSFEEFYFPGTILLNKNYMFFFGGKFKKFPSSQCFKMEILEKKTEKKLEKLPEMPFAVAHPFISLDALQKRIIWVGQFKKSLKFYAFDLTENVWSEIDVLPKNLKSFKFEDEISLFIPHPRKNISYFFSKSMSFSFDVQKSFLQPFRLKALGFNLLSIDLQSGLMNFLFSGNAIRFLRFSLDLALVNLFLNSSFSLVYVSSTSLSSINVPISMDKSLEKRSRKKPIILEDKPLVTLITTLTQFPFSCFSLGRPFMEEKELFLVLSRKVDSSLENFDDVFGGAKSMLQLKHKNIMKIKDFYVISMEIMFLYSGNYEDMGSLCEKDKKPTEDAVFQLLYETVSAMEYLKSNKMFFFEVSPKNILFDIAKKRFKLANFEFETNISRNQYYFENRKLFPYLPPMASLEDIQAEEYEEEEKNHDLQPKFDSLNLDIHKSNVYSLGLSCLSYASGNNNIITFNNATNFEKIHEIIKKLQFSNEIREIFMRMLEINEDLRWDSWSLLMRLKDLKKLFFKRKVDFSCFNDLKPKKESIILTNEGNLLKYHTENDEIEKIPIFFEENPQEKFDFTRVISSCFCFEKKKLFFLFYRENSQNIGFYQGIFNKPGLSLKILEKPIFLENSINCRNLNCLILDGMVFLVGFSFETANGLCFNRSFCWYDVLLAKWSSGMPIPEGVGRDFGLFSDEERLFMMARDHDKLKLFIYDIYRHIWEAKNLHKTTNTLQFSLKEMIVFPVSKGISGFFDIKNKEAFIVDMEKGRLCCQKQLRSGDKEEKGVFYKELLREGERVGCVSVGLGEGENIWIRRKELM